jgi:ATP-dependent Clp protease protease subunit
MSDSDKNPALLLEHGIDIENRTIILVGDVDESMFRRCLLGLRILGAGNVRILLNTFGGDICQAFAIMELLDEHKAIGNVNTHAIGACMSAGALILQAGTLRSASSSCSLMIHFGTEVNSSGNEASHNAGLSRRMKEYFKVRTGRSARAVSSWLDKDTYFTAEEARKQKLIDVVEE